MGTRQGDSLIYLARPNTLADSVGIDSNWTCQVGIYTMQGVEVLASAPVTEKYTHTDGNEYFLVVITPTQTAAISRGTYYLAVEIDNSTISPIYSQESHLLFQILPQFIA